MVQAQFPKNLLRPILNTEQIECPSRTGSVVLWRYFFTGPTPDTKRIAQAFEKQGFNYPGADFSRFNSAKRELYGQTNCPFCEGRGTRYDEYGYYFCICELLKMEFSNQRLIAKYGSQWEPKTLDLDMRFMGDKRKTYESYIKLVTKWIQFPEKWLVFMGKPGTGKSHMMQAIMDAWHPWAMYIVASDFEDTLRNMMSNGGEGIQEYIKTLQNFPLLVLDDLGIEYSTPWIAAKLDAVIEYRSRDVRWYDSLMVIGTNFSKKTIEETLKRQEISRSGSRLLNDERVFWMALTGQDYRQVPK